MAQPKIKAGQALDGLLRELGRAVVCISLPPGVPLMANRTELFCGQFVNAELRYARLSTLDAWQRQCFWLTSKGMKITKVQRNPDPQKWQFWEVEKV